jgi:hypothetical protein
MGSKYLILESKHIEASYVSLLSVTKKAKFRLALTDITSTFQPKLSHPVETICCHQAWGRRAVARAVNDALLQLAPLFQQRS